MSGKITGCQIIWKFSRQFESFCGVWISWKISRHFGKISHNLERFQIIWKVSGMSWNVLAKLDSVQTIWKVSRQIRNSRKFLCVRVCWKFWHLVCLSNLFLFRRNIFFSRVFICVGAILEKKTQPLLVNGDFSLTWINLCVQGIKRPKKKKTRVLGVQTTVPIFSWLIKFLSLNVFLCKARDKVASDEYWKGSLPHFSHYWTLERVMCNFFGFLSCFRQLLL